MLRFTTIAHELKSAPGSRNTGAHRTDLTSRQCISQKAMRIKGGGRPTARFQLGDQSPSPGSGENSASLSGLPSYSFASAGAGLFWVMLGQLRE